MLFVGRLRKVRCDNQGQVPGERPVAGAQGVVPVRRGEVRLHRPLHDGAAGAHLLSLQGGGRDQPGG